MVHITRKSGSPGMNHSMVNYSVCNPPKRKKVFDLLQMDTHVNVALHKYIFVSSPSKNNEIYLDMNDTFIS